MDFSFTIFPEYINPNPVKVIQTLTILLFNYLYMFDSILSTAYALTSQIVGGIMSLMLILGVLYFSYLIFQYFFSGDERTQSEIKHNIIKKLIVLLLMLCIPGIYYGIIKSDKVKEMRKTNGMPTYEEFQRDFN